MRLVWAKGYPTDLGEKEFLTEQGYRSVPDGAPNGVKNLWRPITSTSNNETYANMFLGWVYGAWGNNEYGNARDLFMQTNMVEGLR